MAARQAFSHLYGGGCDMLRSGGRSLGIRLPVNFCPLQLWIRLGNFPSYHFLCLSVLCLSTLLRDKEPLTLNWDKELLLECGAVNYRLATLHPCNSPLANVPSATNVMNVLISIKTKEQGYSLDKKTSYIGPIV